MSIDGIFGRITADGWEGCDSLENLSKSIPEGTYDAVVDLSPRLGYLCPHLRVPLRDIETGGDAGIRIHIANRPDQLEGCIATGTTRNGDSEDSSRDAFDKMMAVLPMAGIPFKVTISSQH